MPYVCRKYGNSDRFVRSFHGIDDVDGELEHIKSIEEETLSITCDRCGSDVSLAEDYVEREGVANVE